MPAVLQTFTFFRILTPALKDEREHTKCGSLLYKSWMRLKLHSSLNVVNSMKGEQYEGWRVWRVNSMKGEQYEGWTVWRVKSMKGEQYEGWRVWRANSMKGEQYEGWTVWRVNSMKGEQYEGWRVWRVNTFNVWEVFSNKLSLGYLLMKWPELWKYR
jgi:hypothetical protein